MAKARIVNQLRNDILTITGGWLKTKDTAVVEDWEAQILVGLYDGKVFVAEQIEEPKPTKKKKK